MHRLAIAAALLLLLASCGDAPRPSSAPDAGRGGKGASAIGTVTARVLERPSSDRAEVEATWTLGAGVSGCEIHFVLPEGAALIEGDYVAALPESESGSTRWLVQFPTGAPLDGVIRLCGHTAGGHGAVETYVRLSD